MKTDRDNSTRAMHLFAGLGNPGGKYQGHRHNVGFMAIDAIAHRHGLVSFRSRFSGEMAQGTIDGKRVILLKPQTWMNCSGNSIVSAQKYYRIQPEQITVFHDELDLAPGKLRLKTGGGNGGHNGIRSIESGLGKEFQRVRIGIGHPGNRHHVQNYVLGDFAVAERKWLDPILATIADNIGLLLSGDGTGFMNRVALAADRSVRKSQADNRGSTPPRTRSRSPRSEPGQNHARGIFSEVLKKLRDKGDGRGI